MKNIILQHYTGTPGELELLSIQNIKKYAEKIGVYYKFIQGDIFRKGLTAPCQKLYMLDAVWDEYDMVVMVDIDMFAVNGLSENVFTDIEGVGLYTDYTSHVFDSCKRNHPTLTSALHPYWGGCLWRLDKELRRKLRKHINEDELKIFSKTFVDEGIMHRLAMLANIKAGAIPQRWSQCSYLPNPEKAAMIHVRTKIKPEGPKRNKIENYTILKNLGIIE